MRLQRTIKEELVFEGVGLHSGRLVVMKLKPAPRNTGIVFYRSDRGVYINASVVNVSDTAFATTLGVNGTRIKTVEHLLATLAGLGVDNVVVELNGPEIPILDGSSLPFAERIMHSGLAKQASNRLYLRVTKPVLFHEGHIEVAVLPFDGRKITYQISFNHRLVGDQKMTVTVNSKTFLEEIAPARTFGFLKDVEQLQAMGLAKGGSLENAVLLSETGVLNTSGLRYKDEFIRHKILDFIGDISLIGFPIYGHFIVLRSGHTTNVKFLKKFLASTDSWETVTGVEERLQAIA